MFPFFICQRECNVENYKFIRNIYLMIFPLFLPRFFIGYWILNGAGFLSWPFFIFIIYPQPSYLPYFEQHRNS